MSRSAEARSSLPGLTRQSILPLKKMDPRVKPAGDAKERAIACCQLICIDPAQAHEFWPHVASLIKAAMEKGRLSSYADVEHAVRNGKALLWLAWNGEKIKAAAVTELTYANGEKFCTIVACGGHERSQWLPLIAGLEAYGRTQGCAAMRIYGRRGWRKLLPEYRTRRVLLEKELTRNSRP
jgi:hypothetical protein